MENLIQPFPEQDLDLEKKIFNYRVQSCQKDRGKCIWYSFIQMESVKTADSVSPQ